MTYLALVQVLYVFLPDIQYPLVTSTQQGMLVDIFTDVMQQMQNLTNTTLQIQYVNNTDVCNISLMFIRNYDTEKAFTRINDDQIVNYDQFDLTTSILQENYMFIFPSLLVTLFQRVVWDLFINYSLTIFPWLMINANLLIFLQDDQRKSYSKKLMISLSIIMGNEKTNLCTLIYKLFFFVSTLFLSSIMFIDFIYVVGNSIQRQNFGSLNDLVMNQFQVCIVDNDPFVLDMVNRYRDMNFHIKPDIQTCLDEMSGSTETVLFVSEFLYGSFLIHNPNNNNLYKFQVKSNSYKGYFMLANTALPLEFRQNLNVSIDQMQLQKYDLGIRSKYLTQLVQKKNTLVSLIFSNKTFLLTSCCTTIVFLLLIQYSALHRHIKLYRSMTPYKFVNIENLGKAEMKLHQPEGANQIEFNEQI